MSCFRKLDPSDFTEVRGYKKNVAFESDDTSALTSLANKALIYFTRAGSSYETEIKERYSYVPARQKQKNITQGKVLPAFNALSIQSFIREKDCFEKAVFFCLKSLCQIFDEEEHKIPSGGDRSGYNDSITLSRFLDDMHFPINGIEYKTHHLLSAFALWKIDRILLAIEYNKADAVGKLLIDAQRAIEIAENFYRTEIEHFNASKVKSQKSAEKGKLRYKSLEKFKLRAIEIYKSREWKSVKRAAEVIYSQLKKEMLLSEKDLTEERGVITISCWLTKSDPASDFSKYPRKKVLRQLADVEEASSKES